MKNLKVRFALIFILALTSSIFAQANKKVEVILPQNISIENVKLQDIGGSFHIKLSNIEALGEGFSGIGIKVSGYDKENKLRTCSKRGFNFKFDNSSRGTIVQKISDDLKSADSYKVEFIPLNSGELESFTGECCTNCTNDAIRACGTGQVGSVSCKEVFAGPDVTCICDYKCKGGIGTEPSGDN
jgi:hypothetical protein